MKKTPVFCLLIFLIISAVLTANASSGGFSDMSGHWAQDFVTKAAERGLFKGDEAGNFNPEANITRGQFITVLWRMAGTPETTENAPFSDISGQIPEFQSAISWGFSKGYINGTSDTTFEPDATLTREAAMKILHSYSGGDVGMEMQFYGIYDGLLTDSEKISPWAKSSVYWGIYNKLLSGTSDTTISPDAPATRAQLAKILVNYLNQDI